MLGTTAYAQKEGADVIRMDWGNSRVDWQRIHDRVVGNRLLLAICVAAVIAIVGIGFGIENNKVVPVSTGLLAHYASGRYNKIGFLADWDGRNYLNIARYGYQSAGATNFFPLYPMATRALTYIVRSEFVSAVLISWAGFAGAVYFYMKIIRQLYKTKGNVEDLRGALLFALFPTGVFLFAAYTEGLFALLAIAAIYFALKRRTIEAAALTLLATATHITGLFVLVFVLLLLWEGHEKVSKIVQVGVIGCLGLISYMVYLAVRFGNPIEFVVAQHGHGWLTYSHTHQLLSEILGRNLIFILLAAGACWYWWNRRRSFALYSALFVCIVVLGNLGGYGRYTLMDFSIPLMFYDYFKDRKLGYALVLAASAVFWMYFLLQFAGGYTGG